MPDATTDTLYLVLQSGIFVCGAITQHAGSTMYIESFDTTGYCTPRSHQRHVTSSLINHVLDMDFDLFAVFSHPKAETIFGKSSLNSLKGHLGPQRLQEFWVSHFSRHSVFVFSNFCEKKTIPFTSMEDVVFFHDDPKQKLGVRDVDVDTFFEMLLHRKDFQRGSLVYMEKRGVENLDNSKRGQDAARGKERKKQALLDSLARCQASWSTLLCSGVQHQMLLKIIGPCDMIVTYGDHVILYIRKSHQVMVCIEKSGATNTCIGQLMHDDVAGKKYGEKVALKRGVVHILKPNVSNRIDTELRVTQILFEQDMGLIIHMLGLCAGKHVIECGTGSGVFTSMLSSAVGVGGLVFTYEVNEQRHSRFETEVARRGYGNVRTFMRDVDMHGFLQESVDAVFLDMPNPLRSIGHASSVLCEGGRVCAFLPSFRQVESALDALRNSGFECIRMFENVMRRYGTFRTHLEGASDVVPKGPQYAHTGYIMFGTR
ncbi:UNVERIFIED_CONTAM: hypothetical protein PYX00_011873 [Menopon gallinae]|uniref:tRNA (adenine(58)-N(1))-methyltransferase n=1 Tax=Menopon gallinae TaxID=328185 RepID=A0AAW2H8Y4_9NEOP